jgi:NAD+ diphosphatase
MSKFDTYFSGAYIERRGELRTDADALAKALADSSSRFLLIQKDSCLIHQSRAALLQHVELPRQVEHPDEVIFLGQYQDQYLFAVEVDDDASPPGTDQYSFSGLRELTNHLPEDEAALLAYAKAMVVWQKRHRYCGVCGTVCRPGEGGFVMACSNPECEHRSFPRLDPAIIVLVNREDKCLLGRQTQWPDGRFSTIAGFAEPGESLEDAVRREVHEETNIRVGDCHYLGSQPWPFPAALMIGYHADALTDDIRLNDGELAEARWLTRDEIAAGAVVLPPKVSIAYRLLETWFDQDHHVTLAELDLPAPPLIEPRR